MLEATPDMIHQQHVYTAVHSLFYIRRTRALLDRLSGDYIVSIIVPFLLYFVLLRSVIEPQWVLQVCSVAVIIVRLSSCQPLIAIHQPKKMVCVEFETDA